MVLELDGMVALIEHSIELDLRTVLRTSTRDVWTKRLRLVSIYRGGQELIEHCLPLRLLVICSLDITRLRSRKEHF